MRILIIRHAIAMPHGTPGIPDDARPLTAEGVRRFRGRARARAHRRCAGRDPDEPAAARPPYGRDRGAALARLAPADAQALVEARSNDVMRLIAKRRARKARGAGRARAVAVRARRTLARRKRRHRFAFKKGGAVLLELEQNPRAARD